MNRDILDELKIIINQTKTLALISPGSVEDKIYSKCCNAYKIIEKGGDVSRIDISGLSRQYADSNGYTAPLLINLSRLEQLLKDERRKNEY